MVCERPQLQPFQRHLCRIRADSNDIELINNDNHDGCMRWCWELVACRIRFLGTFFSDTCSACGGPNIAFTILNKKYGIHVISLDPKTCLRYTWANHRHTCIYCKTLLDLMLMHVSSCCYLKCCCFTELQSCNLVQTELTLALMGQAETYWKRCIAKRSQTLWWFWTTSHLSLQACVFPAGDCSVFWLWHFKRCWWWRTKGGFVGLWAL